jgi:hypothetical protein
MITAIETKTAHRFHLRVKGTMCSKGTPRGNAFAAQPRKPETFSPGIAISALMKKILISD